MAFDVITPANLGRGAIGITNTLFHTVEANTRSIVKDIDVGNTSTSDIAVNVYLVPSGDSPSTSNVLFPNMKVKADTSYGGISYWRGSQVLNEGDTIYAIASGLGLTINISGGIAT